jgi:hypothetical protein
MQTDEDVALLLADDVVALYEFRTRNQDAAGKMLAAMYVRDRMQTEFKKANIDDVLEYSPRPMVAHAEQEMKLAGWGTEENELDRNFSIWIGRNVLDLLFWVSRQRHSGGTMIESLRLFLHLANKKALSPITNNPAEWDDKSAEAGYPFWQNNRASSCFSTDGGKTFFDVDEQPISRTWLDHTWAFITRQPLEKFATHTSKNYEDAPIQAEKN